MTKKLLSIDIIVHQTDDREEASRLLTKATNLFGDEFLVTWNSKKGEPHRIIATHRGLAKKFINDPESFLIEEK